MRGRWPFTAEKISTRLDLIATHVHRRSVALPPFRLFPLPGAIIDAPICNDPTHWDVIEPQSYWGHADLNFVMKTAFSVPQGWDPKRLALYLPLGVLGDIFNHPEALVHVDRQSIGSADRYHHTIPLAPHLADGATHVLSLHGWTGLAGWPPDPKSAAKLHMGRPCLVERDPALFAFHLLASTVLDTVKVLDPESAVHHALLNALDDAFKTLETRDPIGAELYASVPKAMAVLERGLAHAGDPLDVTLHGIGHAHMDIAYLWPISQIRLKNARTYSNVLRLMTDDTDYYFSHSQPALYEMTAQDYPAIFDQIKARVADGRWEVMGGMWVEPDLNIPGGEALIRQLTLGRGYFRDVFGDVETPVLWLPDTFGFPAQIPQLMRLAGLKWFVTNKLNWNQINKVDASSHHWEGIDGSRVLAHVLTTPRDVQYLPFPTNYKSDLSAPEVMGTWTNSSAKTYVRDLPICFGYGDGGGGPTEELLAKAHAYAAMPGMPRLKMGTVRDAFAAIERSAADLSVWRGEHYMEGHRGVFTSQGWIKRANRKAEWALHEAEALAAMAGQTPDLTRAWKLLCLNQFHDIITGTSIGAVFEDARRDFSEIMTLAEAVSDAAEKGIALSELSVANTSPMTGSRLAFVEKDDLPNAQSVEGGALVYFDALPSYSIVPVSTATLPEGKVSCRAEHGRLILENPDLRVTLDANGHLTNVHDKSANRSVLKPGEIGNRLIAFEDRPICWDAWDVDPHYEDRRECLDGDAACEIIEKGPLRASVRVTRTWRSSTIRQTIRLCAHSKRLDFETDVDWHETHTLLKAAFPTSVSAPQAKFDVQWGRVSRSTLRETPFDAARFEVPAHKWAQLSDSDYTVAVLNDCKYGYDVTQDTIRLTLIKCATSPDPKADQGVHRFTYSLLPYEAETGHQLDVEAYDLNAPLRVLAADPGVPGQPRTLVQSTNAHVIVETVKPASDGRGIVLRLFEAHGCDATTDLCFDRPVATVQMADIFEAPLDTVPVEETSSVRLNLQPFQILTLRVVFAVSQASQL